MKTLTDRQREVLQLLRGGATYREICSAIGATSTNAADCHVKALIRKGVVEHGDRRSRNISRRYLVTEAGMRELGLRCCPTCGGNGAVSA